MRYLKLLLIITLLLILGPGAVIFHLHEGNVIAAWLWSIPVTMITLAIFLPGIGPGHFALTHQFGPIRENDESESQFHLKLAKWWFLGFMASITPLISMWWLSKLLPKDQSELAFAGSLMLAFILGIACLIKLITSLIKAYENS